MGLLRVLCLLLSLSVSVHSLRLMTFNTWLGGRSVNDGMAKIAKHILAVDPDIVALQEIGAMDWVRNLTEMLGPPWTGVYHCNRTLPDTAIVTKHKIQRGSYGQVLYGMGARIQLNNGKEVSVWSLHLEYHSYGPYAAFNKLVINASQILAGEFPKSTVGRVQNIVELIVNPVMQQHISQSNSIPVIVAGDFNAPSDLDWIEENKDMHGGWAYEWPATKLLRDSLGMTDSYRELYPDPIKYPGLTWSTVNKAQQEWDYSIPEVMDRIDFINYRGPLKPTASYTYAGSLPLTPIPHHKDNDYPSDHYAFVTEFKDVDIAHSGEPSPPVIRLPDREVIRSSLQVTATNDLKMPGPFCEDNYVDRGWDAKGLAASWPKKDAPEGVNWRRAA